MEENTNVQVENSTEAATEVAKTYTQREVDSLISKAVNDAVVKAKSKASKSSEERISELEREIARRDNQEYARSRMAELKIDSSLASLIYSGSNEDTDAKLEVLSNWYNTAVDNAVNERIGETKPIKMAQSSNSNKPRTLAERQAQLDNRR